MATYITTDDVDSELGIDWTDASKKTKAVFMANVWMTGLGIKLAIDKDTGELIIPDDVKQAGAYASLSAANGGLYQQKESSGALASQSVEAKGVKVSETYTDADADSSTLLDSDLQLAMAILKPYGIGSSQIKLVRG